MGAQKRVPQKYCQFSKTNENIAATRNLAFHSVTNIFHFNYFPFSYSI